jgi:predicted PolB exonuclease-like 3'-5' exonuclease
MAETAYLVFDIETIPDGSLIGEIHYPGLSLSTHEAVIKFQDETRSSSPTGSDFLPLTFHLPVAVCVLRIGADFRIQTLSLLDQPAYRTPEIVHAFWKGVSHYKAALVSFNGRCFDVPVLELAAFRYGLSIPWHYKGHKDGKGPRHRYGNLHLDLLDFFSNYNAHRLSGGLNLLAKLIGIPGKFEMKGSEVYSMIQNGEVQKVNEYCSFDVLDTYFIFLRTRVLCGDISLDEENHIRRHALGWLKEESAKQPHLQRYLANWEAPVVGTDRT